MPPTIGQVWKKCEEGGRVRWVWMLGNGCWQPTTYIRQSPGKAGGQGDISNLAADAAGISGEGTSFPLEGPQ